MAAVPWPWAQLSARVLRADGILLVDEGAEAVRFLPLPARVAQSAVPHTECSFSAGLAATGFPCSAALPFPLDWPHFWSGLVTVTLCVPRDRLRGRQAASTRPSLASPPGCRSPHRRLP